MASYHAYVFDGFGDPVEKLKWTEVSAPKIQQDTEVLVKVVASPINPSDLGYVTGWYPVSSLPSRNGVEAVGVVQAVGTAVKDLTVGQRVHFFQLNTPRNAWSEVTTFDTKNDYYVPIPDYISDIAASQLSANPMSVVGLLDESGIRKGEFVLQNAAASSAGKMLIQYAKAKGFKTINVVRREEQVKELLDLGADYVINSEKESVPAKVKEYTQNQGAPYAIDYVAGQSGATLLESLALKGTLLVFGALSGQSLPVHSHSLVFKEAQIHGFSVKAWIEKQSPAEIRKVYEEWFELLKSKVVHFSGKTFDGKTQLADAIKFSTAPGRAEKAILLF